MKVGITSFVLSENTYYSNGIALNVKLWYHFLQEKCGFDVSILTNDKIDNIDNPENYKYIYFMDLWDSSGKIIPNYKQEKPELFDFDVVFLIGFSDTIYFSYLHKHNIKLIYVMLGSNYHNDISDLIRDNKFASIYYEKFDEIWISPHFQYCQEYYKIRYKTDNVFISPYFWRNDFLIKDNIIENVLTDINELKVAVFEPNIEQAKFFLIPLSICEKAHNDITKLKIFNSTKFNKNTFFNKLIVGTNLHKTNKLCVEGRHSLGYILTTYCNCVVSYVEDCDLNYVFLECFYLGVPLIHNSIMLKDYGYYYPRLNVTRGAEQIKNVIKNHNRQQYINKHKPLLDKYSINNPLYATWVKEKLKKNINCDCI